MRRSWGVAGRPLGASRHGSWPGFWPHEPLGEFDLAFCVFARPYLRSRGLALPHSALAQHVRNWLQHLARIAAVIQACSES